MNKNNLNVFSMKFFFRFKDAFIKSAFGNALSAWLRFVIFGFASLRPSEDEISSLDFSRIVRIKTHFS